MNDRPANAFAGRKELPTDADLAGVLGPSKAAWDGLIREMADQFGVTVQEWRSYSVKNGWALRLLRGKRTILWLAPFEGSFEVLFILGEKAVHAAREGGLSARLLRILDEAPKYPEGTGVRLRMKGPKDLPAVRKLAAVKLAN